MTPKKVVVFRASDERMPFDEWLQDLKDQNAVARVLARLGRVRQGSQAWSVLAANDNRTFAFVRAH